MENDKAVFREFDKFRLDVEMRTLWYDKEIVALPPKAVELLAELTNRPGTIFTKNDLMDSVWEGAFVEESNLTHYIYLLRKTLSSFSGRDYIDTVPKRGYRFSGRVEDVFEQSELTIERRLFTQTVIEEIPSQPETAVLPVDKTPTLDRAVIRRKTILTGTALAGLLLALLFGGVAIWNAFSTSAGSTLDGIKQVAVLPIRAQGDLEESIRFGLTDSLTARLHALGVFAVRPASSMFTYDQDLRDPIAIGRQLGLDAIMDGSVQNENGRLRVNLQFIDLRTGANIWTGQFDGRPETLLDLHDVIFSKLIDDTGLSQTAVNTALASKPPTQNIEAYKAYHRGRVLFSDLSGHPDSSDNAVKEFETALTLDPNFTLALTGLADVFSRKANQHSFDARDEYYTKALELARRAVEADPNMPEGHVSYAWIKRNYEWDFRGSEAHFRRALELSPSHPEAHRQYSFLLSTMGRHREAVDHARRAVDLDPGQMNYIRSYALILIFAREYDEALRQYEHFFKLYPSNTNELRYVVWALHALGRDHELIERFENLPETARNSFQTKAYYALAYRRSRNAADGDRMISELARESTKRGDQLVRFATTLATLGRSSEALDLLEEGLRRRDDRMLWVKAQPELESLRGEPRYQAILREMKLED